MAVSKQQKIDILTGLVAQFKEAKSIGFSTTSTLTVAEFSDLRTSLREVGATYTLAKKTLIKKAIKEAIDIDVDLSTLPGQIGVVCSNEDAVAGLGKVNDLVKKTDGEKITWAACIFDGELKNLEETKVLAALPSKDTLLSRMVGSMMSPLSGMARLLDAISKETETQGKQKAGELEAKKEEAATPEVKKEAAPKQEAKAEEVVAEKAPTTEAKTEETPTEKTEEAPTTEAKKDEA